MAAHLRGPKMRTTSTNGMLTANVFDVVLLCMGHVLPKIVRTCPDCGLSIGLHSAVCLCFLRMIICVMQPTYGNRMAT